MEKKTKRIPWNKGLSGEAYKKHYPNGFKNKPFPKGHKINSGKKLGIDHKKKISAALKGKNKGPINNMWRGGKIKTSKGYRLILMPEHPFCDSKGYILEHRLVMEKHLGRYLKPSEIVHHKDKNPSNNNLKNLKLFKDLGAHQSFHRNLIAKLKNDSKGLNKN